MNEDNEGNPPPIEGGAPAPAKALSQGFLDAQRALKLKWAVARGTHKDGAAVSDDDRAWFEAWTKAHPPKAKPEGAPRTRAATPDIEDKTDYPDPAPNAPAPKVDPTTRKGKGKPTASATPTSGWQAKYRIKVTLPNGVELSAVEQRELVCVQGASIICGIAKAAEDGLALIGAKPYLGMSTDGIFGAWVLTLDKVLPDIELGPEHIALGGMACIMLPAALNFKKIRAARQGDAAKDEHEAKLAELRAATKRKEQEYQERQEQERKAKAAQPAQAEAKVDAPQAEPAVAPTSAVPADEHNPTPPSTPPVGTPRAVQGGPEVRPNIHRQWDSVDPMFSQE